MNKEIIEKLRAKFQAEKILQQEKWKKFNESPEGIKLDKEIKEEMRIAKELDEGFNKRNDAMKVYGFEFD
jgi:hypothetical protein